MTQETIETLSTQQSEGQTHSLQKRKIELCRTFTQQGYCLYGNNCFFAHGVQQLSQHQPSLKKKLCRNFHKHSFCKYGFRCNFLHQIKPLNKILGKKSAKSMLQRFPEFAAFKKFKKSLISFN